MRTPFAPDAGSDTLCRYPLGNPADGIDVQPENTSHFHTCGKLGIHQLRNYQPPRGAVVLSPLEQPY